MIKVEEAQLLPAGWSYYQGRPGVTFIYFRHKGKRVTIRLKGMPNIIIKPDYQNPNGPGLPGVPGVLFEVGELMSVEYIDEINT